MGGGKSLKLDISFVVLLTVELMTHDCPSRTFSVKRHRPPTSSARSKQTGSRPSSRHALVAVSPQAPAPITATRFTAGMVVWVLSVWITDTIDIANFIIGLCCCCYC